MINAREIKDVATLMQKAKWLEGKRLYEIQDAVIAHDPLSRVKTKGTVGYVIEEGYFGIKKNSEGCADLPQLGIEIKTCPVEYNNKEKTIIHVKEPLSLGIINYTEEAKHDYIKQSKLYSKNKKILFVVYLHDKSVERSKYKILKVFLWEMTDDIVELMEPDYKKIVENIRAGKAHEIHQDQHKILTICPKHNGKFKDPHCHRSKTKQPFSSAPAEIRAFRIKSRFMDIVLSNAFGKTLGKHGWSL